MFSLINTITIFANPEQISLEPGGRFLYVINPGVNLSVLNIGADGSLSNPVSFYTGASAGSIFVVTNYNN